MLSEESIFWPNRTSNAELFDTTQIELIAAKIRENDDGLDMHCWNPGIQLYDMHCLNATEEQEGQEILEGNRRRHNMG